MPATLARARAGTFTVDLVSKAFSGRPQLERHKLVYAAVAPADGTRRARVEHSGRTRLKKYS